MRKSVMSVLADLFLPRSCLVCRKELLPFENYMCLDCLAGLPLTYFWKIPNNPAETVFWGKLPVERVYCLFFYTNDYRRLIRAFKYNYRIEAGLYLSRMLGNKIKEDPLFEPPDAVIPVPLHRRKKWKRGYNQAEIIARGIARITGGKTETRYLKRKQFTRTQTRKDKFSRWKNVQEAFEIFPRKGPDSFSGCPVIFGRHKNRKVQVKTAGLDGLHVLLVDDVLTTGATLEACGALLLKEYRCKLSIAALAFVE